MKKKHKLNPETVWNLASKAKKILMLRRLGFVLILSFLAAGSLCAQEAPAAGSVISLEEARQMTRDFTATQGGIQSYFFSKGPFLELLAQPNTHGLRFWYGRKDQRLTLVAVGTDAKGQDLRDGIIVDDVLECPPNCPTTLASPSKGSRLETSRWAPGRKPSQAGTVISLGMAEALTKGFSHSYDGVRSHLYSAKLFRQLLTQEGAQGLRIYPGWKNGKPRLVFFATDALGENLEDFVVDNGHECPPDCPTAFSDDAKLD